MSITKHFEETFYLGFEDLNLNRELKPRDILFSELIFLRITKDKLIFHYLNSSDQILIPGVYLNLFTGMDRLLEDELKEPKTNLEKFLFLGSRLSRMIYGGDKTNIEMLLSDMVKIGSKDLRKLLKEKFNYQIEPWTLRNITNTIEI